MKRRISLLLTLALCGSVVAPMGTTAVAAESPVDQQLTQVTEIVKKTLGIGNEYTDFYGNMEEKGLVSMWSLNWSNEEKKLHVTADTNGKVLWYYLDFTNEPWNNDSNLPSFPKTSRVTARQTAQTFMEKVLGENESIVFDTDSSASDTDNHMFNGKILLNELPSPFTFSVTVDGENNEIIRFFRSEDSYSNDTFLGTVPSPKASAGEGNSAKQLKKTLKLKLEYVSDTTSGTPTPVTPRDDADKAESSSSSDQQQPAKRAVLRYLPEDIDSYYVDASTGFLVNLTERYKEVADSGEYLFGQEAAADMENGMGGGSGNMKMSASRSLSTAEQAGVDKLRNLLSKDRLNQKLRGMDKLGLDNYSLTDFRYWIEENPEAKTQGKDQEKAKGQVTVYARLSYVGKDDPDNQRTSFVMNARTGEIQSISSSTYYDEERISPIVSEEQAQQKAMVFLRSLWPEEADELECYESRTDLPGGMHYFTFARKVNGYFFPEHYFEVGVSTDNGIIRELNWNFDKEYTFQDAKNLISAEEAQDAWFASYQTTLGYQLVPTALNPSDVRWQPLGNALIDTLTAQGRKYYHTLCLTYRLTRDTDYVGVDAVTAKLVEPFTYHGRGVCVYTDIENAAAKEQIESLAQYGIGFPGETFQPDKQLTQLDWLFLLATARGSYFGEFNGDVIDESIIDDLYNQAYRFGLLTAEQRNEEAVLSRGETVKMLLDCAGLQEIAQLPGIFKCAFVDAAEIPTSYYGYAALAQGMKIVPAEGTQPFAATTSATRSDAAVMLYNYMNRG